MPGAIQRTDRECFFRPIDAVTDLPEWFPKLVVTYLAHTSGGLPLRALARARGCHASTILRQVRKVETWRDSPLVDEVLEIAGPAFCEDFAEKLSVKEIAHMMASVSESADNLTPNVEREARRILRRLCEKGAFLAVATGMAKAAVMRELVAGRPNRIAVVDRDVAHAFALQDWIKCDRSGKISCYSITTTGRAALKRLLAAQSEDRAEGLTLCEAATPFRAQHQEMGERRIMSDDGSGEKTLRCNLAESPLGILARKRDASGSAYLSPELVEAGERLREDFELAQMGPRVTQNWERFLTAQDKGTASGNSPSEGSAAARKRVSDAVTAMGPGLSDIVFRICCFLEGLETAEKRMGWSARSGKVVLKIALQRLAQHYGLERSASGQREAG